MSRPSVLAFSGSLRQGSLNQKLVKLAARGAAKSGADVRVIDLADFLLPIFDEDVESRGTPAEAVSLKAMMKAADGMLIASPEYNSSLSGALKNAVDWASRKAEGESALEAFSGKAVAVMAASPSPVGGLRGLMHLRQILSHIQMHVLPGQMTLCHADEAFDDAGELKDPKLGANAEKLGRTLAEYLKRHPS
ncbi:MAG: NAD(P)H-dependent oxidoreductase [Planctomycetota bacterium]